MIELKEISKYAGERFDLVQAGGGNTSVKLNDNEMIIKASGFSLSDVSESSGFSRVYTNKIAGIVRNKDILNSTNKREREKITEKLVRDSTMDDMNRPSIETLLHSLLHKYTLHTHPIVVNMIVMRKDWKAILKVIFDDVDFVAVEYKTPGIELALALDCELTKINHVPKIVFLQNHGLIITSNKKQEIKELTEYVLNKIEKYLSIDMQKYKLTNKITDLFNSVEINSNISYLCEDMFLNEQLNDNQEMYFSKPFCPDSLVYCGVNAVYLHNLLDVATLLIYKEQFNELPKVVIFENRIFFIAVNVKKAKELEEVFKFHIMVLLQNKELSNNFLDLEELAYLSNWEAEQFRREL